MSTSHYSLKDKRYIIGSIFILFAIWQVIAIKIDNRLILPSSLDVLKSTIGIIKEDGFFVIIAYSIARGIYSFVISISIALILAVISYFNKVVYNIIFPIISIIKAVPTMAFIVILLIWTSKDNAPIVIGIMISLPIFYDTILNSILKIDNKMLYMCKVYNVTVIDKIKEVIFPVIIIELSKIISSTFSLIFKVVISGEVYAQPQYGIGAIIQMEKVQLNTAGIIAWILIITLVSYIFELILSFIKVKSVY